MTPNAEIAQKDHLWMGTMWESSLGSMIFFKCNENR